MRFVQECKVEKVEGSTVSLRNQNNEILLVSGDALNTVSSFLREGKELRITIETSLFQEQVTPKETVRICTVCATSYVEEQEPWTIQPYCPMCRKLPHFQEPRRVHG